MLTLAGVVLCLALTSAQFIFQVPSQYEDLYKETLELVNNCKKKTGAQEDIQQLISTLTVPSSAEGKCMVACVFQEKGVMKDDKVDPAAAKEFLEKTFPDLPQTLRTIADSIMAKCSSSGSGGKDGCENAAAYVSCAKKAFFEGDF